MSTNPKTPLRAMSGPLLTNLSTPIHRGSGANTSQSNLHKVDDYQPYLAEDLRQKKNISFDQFFEHIFKVDTKIPLSKDLQALAKNPKFKKLLKAIPGPGGLETDRYGPFTALANYCLGRLVPSDRKGAHAWFCRNDNKYIRGSDAGRKPDVFIVDQCRVEGFPGRVSAQECTKNGPVKEGSVDGRFWWSEVWSYLEFETYYGISHGDCYCQPNKHSLKTCL